MAIPAAWQGACLPVLGEVCFAKFPYDESPDDPGPKSHPVVILALRRKEPFSLFVAYGSSQKLDTVQPWDVVLSTEEANEVGLARSTRFHLDRRLWLPYDDVWFERAFGRPTPRIGSLPSIAMKRLSAARITWETAHQQSLIPGQESRAKLINLSGLEAGEKPLVK